MLKDTLTKGFIGTDKGDYCGPIGQPRVLNKGVQHLSGCRKQQLEKQLCKKVVCQQNYDSTLPVPCIFTWDEKNIEDMQHLGGANKKDFGFKRELHVSNIC